MDIKPPSRLLILDIDGLRRDVFLNALESERIPNLARVLGGPQVSNGLHLQTVSTCPSITFCAQTSLLTGLHPDEHGITGNQFFDRFGQTNHGKPRFYAFDVGDSLAVNDAVGVFRKNGLLSKVLDSKSLTLYEYAALNGCKSLVAYHMIGRGASTWIRPSLVDIARFTKGGGLTGLSAQAYDERMLKELMAGLNTQGPFDLITAYFMGLDHHSHQHGPQSQPEYLERILDPQVGQLIDQLSGRGELENTLVLIVSDHGQVAVIPDDLHSLRLSFPYDLEMGYLFKALNIDVNDKPGEGIDCDAIVASNGGLAHIYLRHPGESWKQSPHFTSDVLKIADAFWQANLTGRYAPDVKDALSAILIRNVEKEGWNANYSVYSPTGIQSLPEFLESHPELPVLEAQARIDRLSGVNSGDLILISNYAGGYYFGAPIPGMHGGLHPDESRVTLSMGWPDASSEQLAHLRTTVQSMVALRCQQEKRQMASLVDILPILRSLMGWK